MESNLSCMNSSVAACEYPERQKPGFCSQDCVTDTLHDEALACTRFRRTTRLCRQR